MLKILIVDDEVLERKVLSRIIGSSSDLVKVIGEAPNGRTAIEMAIELRPDIMFMDIKMPGIDGVQAVKEIRKFNPEIRFIMVSAFNTFEYAKEVMQQGVKEYILKPSSKKDILESLNRVSKEILEERKRIEEHQHLKENLNLAFSIAQKEWVSSLLLNQVKDITFDEWGQLFSVEITSGFIALFSLEAHEGTELTTDELQSWHLWLSETLKIVVKKQEIMIGPLNTNQIPVLVLCRKGTEKSQIKISMQSNIERIFTFFKKESFKGHLKIGIGRLYSDEKDLNKSYHEAVAALKQLSNQNKRYFFLEKQELKELPSQSAIFEFEKELLDAIRQGDVNNVLYIYDSFISKFNEKTSVLKRLLDEIFILILRMLHDLGINYQQVPLFTETEELIELVEKGKTYLLEVVQNVQVWRNIHASGILHNAKEFIELHYSDQLSLEQVSEYVGISPFYFSKLFRDRFGMTFIDYLTGIRITKAKEEMNDTQKSLKEICFSIGYKDPNYFSRVFKKVTGKSPTEFRKTAQVHNY
ncbi:response regulator [Bacillus sp. ISL-18]|uniref:response regulator n=1 Tax=Bacillus sp. ISL-18 TaxID=2819118 RepID=UPI001BEBBD4B|nr:response regulator [Bacillus sp. ISL-18]MBT2658369.1 response regulator [Bacillus sp. ISL-18]